MNNTEQYFHPEMAGFNKLFEMLDRISARVVMIEDTEKVKRYSVTYGKEGATVCISGNNVIIKIYQNKNMVSNHVIHIGNKPDIKSAMVSLEEMLDLHLKAEQIMNPSKTIKVPFSILKVEQKKLEVSNAVLEVSKRQY